MLYTGMLVLVLSLASSFGEYQAEGVPESAVTKPTELGACRAQNEALNAQVSHLTKHLEAMSLTHADSLGAVHNELNQKIVTLNELESTMQDLEERVQACEVAEGGGRRKLLTDVNLEEVFDNMLSMVASTRILSATKNITAPLISATSNAVLAVLPETSERLSSGESYSDLLFRAVQEYLDAHVFGTRIVLPVGIIPRLMLAIFSITLLYVFIETLILVVFALIALLDPSAATSTARSSAEIREHNPQPDDQTMVVSEKLRLWPKPKRLSMGHPNASSITLSPSLVIDIDERPEFRAFRERLLYRTTSKGRDSEVVGTLQLTNIRIDFPESSFDARAIERLSEAYELSMDMCHDGESNHNVCCTITAESWVGAIRGMESLTQLINCHGDGHCHISGIGLPFSLNDWPSFEHRGVMVDVSRHFISLRALLRTVDA
ncbi:hypothetical protein FOL47_000640, partial [Perkinsus chesapeaki]